MTADEMSHAALSRPIVATCGSVSVWAVALLRAAGYEARVVTTLTLEPWNGTDNGHTLVEVHQGDWVVYDVDRHVRYTDLSGKPLSLTELVALVPSDAYRIVSLVDPVSESVIREENHRLLQVEGVEDGGFYWFGASGDTARRIESYAPTYRALPPAEWAARFA